MYSLDDAFNELMDKIRDPDALNPAKSDPVFYFAYPPERMLDLKKRLPRWTSRIREAGFDVRRVSMADLLWKIVDDSGRWDIWLELEDDAGLDQINGSVRDVLRQGNELLKRVVDIVESSEKDTFILITETELLHPYFRTRVIEGCLHDRVETPTVILYPGNQSGQFGLRFLGFYPVDPNYRSPIIGGNQ